jgi:hypothetical protein
MGAKHYLDIRITFDRETDDYDPDYEYFSPKKAYQVESTLPQGAAESVAETWAQSDHYILLSPDLIINALCDQKTRLSR